MNQLFTLPGAEAAQNIQNGIFDAVFKKIYGNSDTVLCSQRNRYAAAVQEFAACFGQKDRLAVFSAPGRTEICGNHTDHNHGKVLAASVNLDVIAIAAANSDQTVRIQSKGYKMDVVDLACLEPVQSEHNKSTSLVRGLCARFKMQGHFIGGFDAYTTSDVLKGSGLSSSAAYEVLVGTAMNWFYNSGTISNVAVAQYSQFAENHYFGKASGLLDQLTCSVGGFITVDFKDPSVPVIEKVAFDFAASGYQLCIVDTQGSHADLSDEYSAIPAEMKSVAAFFGKPVLREVDQDVFFSKIGEVRQAAGDRAVLRAIHFFQENKRVELQANALLAGDFECFKMQVIASGNSSFRYLQNIYANSEPSQQGLSLALCLAEKLLAGKGAWRVHGGGFAGTIQAFVPDDMADMFASHMENVFGKGNCHILSVRPAGGICLCGPSCGTI